MPMTFENVRRFALTLADVEEGTSYGTPAFRAKGTLFVRLREDPDILVVRSSFEQREELIAAEPDIYFVTDHYLNYPWVLVRLSRIHADALRDLVRSAWRSASAAKSRAGSRTRTTTSKTTASTPRARRS